MSDYFQCYDKMSEHKTIMADVTDICHYVLFLSKLRIF